MISFSAVFVKLVSMGPTAIGFYRVFIAGVILMLFVRLRGGILLKGGAMGLIVAAALFYMGDLWVWHQSIEWIGPGLATLLAAFQVFILTAVGILVYRERAGWRLFVAVPLALLGLTLLVGLDWSILSPEKRAGVWLGLATAVFYAGYLLCLREARARAVDRTAAGDLALVSLTTAVFLGAASFYAGETLVVEQATDAAWLTTYAIGSQVIAWVLISSGLPHIPASRAGLLLLLQPTLSFVWDILFFHRPVAAHEAAGLVIALFAIWLGSQRTDNPTASDKIAD
ncbi:MAG: DMT family transporter [Gammaproteobacteria bacterium]|nr:DMT family transporter [Gammaproteobacteria bacterium]NNF62381.1 DMT family transporter [Gammaproteobacteria bacterium]NNM20929.1 DMT family transporter [Gammaproteobacteria bacterium]